MLVQVLAQEFGRDGIRVNSVSPGMVRTGMTEKVYADAAIAAERDALVPLGVTQLSAGSHTEPGGYASPSDAEAQFEISDTRSPAEVAAMLRGAGYDPVWMDTIGPRR